MTRRVSVSLPDDVVAAIDAVADEYSLNRSRIIRDVLGKWIDGEGLEQAVEDAIPEATRKRAQMEARQEEIMDEQTIRERRHNFEDRVRGYFRQRLEGDAAYPVEGMEELAIGYRDDARNYHRDHPEELEQKLDMVDRFLEFYRMGFFAREHAETVDTEVNSEDVDGWFEVGEDIYRLRHYIDDVIEVVEAVAGRDHGYQSTAVVEAVAKRFSVSEGAVMLLLEHMVEPAGTSIQDAINLDQLSGESLDLAGTLEGGPSAYPDPDGLPEDARLSHQAATGEKIEYSEIESETDDD